MACWCLQGLTHRALPHSCFSVPGLENGGGRSYCAFARCAQAECDSRDPSPAVEAYARCLRGQAQAAGRSLGKDVRTRRSNKNDNGMQPLRTTEASSYVQQINKAKQRHTGSLLLFAFKGILIHYLFLCSNRKMWRKTIAAWKLMRGAPHVVRRPRLSLR